MEILNLKVKTRQEVADEYNVCVKTLLSQLADCGIKLKPGLIFPKTQMAIYNALGMPPFLKKS